MHKVLIVEDNVDLSNLFQMVLDLDGVPSEICRDGRDAEGVIESLQPRVVILDMHLPNVSGASIFKYLKKSHPEIAVLIVTADRDLYSEYRNKTKAFLKPMDMDVLRDEVRAAL
ncbi:MAG: response regulator [Anaerolineae bacterium]|jgi:DNA-binding NtrC family response regulator|nr:response regulator [Anaerolineae bacterium]